MSGGPRGGAAFGFIFASAVANAMAFGLVIPVLPGLIRSLAGGDTASAAEAMLLFSAAFGLMQFVSGPVLGLLSDRFGRRPVLLISLSGLAADLLVMAVAPNLVWLFLGRIVSGMTSASMAAANAYVADVTTPDGRARAFGWMSAALGFGFVLGPALGGVLAQIHLRLPFVVAGLLTALNAAYGLFVLPESLPSERSARGLDWRRTNPLAAIAFLRGRGDLAGLAAIGLIAHLAFMVGPTTFVLYVSDRYGWTPAGVGAAMMATGGLGVLVQTTLIGRIVRLAGERGAVLIGAAAAAAAYAAYGWAPNGWCYLAAAPLYALYGVLQPSLMALMTRRVDAAEQGRLQGVTQSLQGLASIVGPILFGSAFAWALHHRALGVPGLAFYAAAGLMGIALLLTLAVAPLPRRAALSSVATLRRTP